jgi:hypothetical protein
MDFFSLLPGGKFPAIDRGCLQIDLPGAPARAAPKVISIATPRYQRLKAATW